MTRSALATKIRIVASDASSALERFSDPALLGRGVVSLIGLDAVIDALGDRWPARREQVYAHVDRTLGKYVEPGGYHIRVSETDYLVVRPDLSRFAAQAAGLTYLRELLQHFLGAAAPAVINIRQVTRLEGDVIEAEPVDMAALAVADGAAAGLAGEAAAGPAQAALFNETRWNPFLSADGRLLTVSCVLEPLFELRGFTKVGFRMRRKVVDRGGMILTEKQLAVLASIDIERVDLATIARGVSRCLSQSSNKEPTLMVPLSCVTLSSHRGRLAMAEALEIAARAVHRGLVAELIDVDLAASGAVLAATNLLKPYCRILVGGLSVPPTSTLEHLRHAGLQGLTFDGAEAPAVHGAFKRWADARVCCAKRVVRSVVIHGLPDARHAALAGLAGASHASLGSRSPVFG